MSSPRRLFRTFLYRNFIVLYHSKVHLRVYFRGTRGPTFYGNLVFEYETDYPEAFPSLVRDIIEAMGESIQGRGRGVFGGMDTDLVEVLAGAYEKGQLVRVPGYNANVNKLTKTPKNPLRDQMNYMFPDIDFKEYMHSSHKGPKESVKKLAGLYNKRASKIEENMTAAKFCCLWASSVALHTTWGENGEPVHGQPIQPEDLHKILYKDASTGYADPDFGRKRTSKKEEAVLVEIQIRLAEKEKTSPLHVLAAKKKAEVLERYGKLVAEQVKDLKGVRFFYVANSVEYGALTANGLRQQAADGQTMADARVMPQVGGFYYALIMQLTRHLGEVDFIKREEYVEEVGTYNFDVKGWEYSVGTIAKTIYCLGIRSTIGAVLYPYSLAGALASFIVPIVLLQGEFGIIAPRLLPSGNLCTFDCNTSHNRMITIDFAKTVPEAERAALFSSGKAGDDAVTIRHKFIPQMKQHYQDWGMEVAEEGSGHFLQRFINIEKRTMDPIKKRVLNKIYHGEGTMDIKAQQVYSMYQTMGSDCSYMHKLLKVTPRPSCFRQCADGDHLGAYGCAIKDDVQLRVFHEPADPNYVKLCWATEILHNNTPRHMQHMIDIKKSREKTMANFPHFF